MTEDEARKKWCPFVRVLLGSPRFDRGTPAFNRYLDIDTEEKSLPKNSYCIASDCMAWRWGTEKNAPYYHSEPSTTAGYCGLAK